MRRITTRLVFTSLLWLAALPAGLYAQIPATHSRIGQEGEQYYLEWKDTRYREMQQPPLMTLDAAYGNPDGTKKGIAFDFGIRGFEGRIYYGFIPYGDSRHPQPVFFKETSTIKDGRAEIVIAGKLNGRYDMIGWESSGKGTLGYRVESASGLLLYEGRISFTGTGPFKIDDSIIEGPFVNCVTPGSAVIAFRTNNKVRSTVQVGAQIFEDDKPCTAHEIDITGLEPGTRYDYTVTVGANSRTFAFETAPAPGSRTAFTFAYASDSRSGQGGGERDMYGANFYIMKKIFALATQQQAAFFQFSGDLIDGYKTSVGETELQYANWKRAIEPFAHYLPVYISMGNHEALVRAFSDGKDYITVDRFPYETESAEAIFARHFVNPRNGPLSEDGSSYDPNPRKQDFPGYTENVFSYTYDNVAVIVLNTNYWYAPSTGAVSVTSGNIHAYIMDQQLAWLEQMLGQYEGDSSIDHIFLTLHTPFFPNGGHVSDDMWYGGNNSYRPYVAGKPVAKGIIERRDEMLDLLVNRSEKVIAILTGDEHNYARTEVGPDMDRYPDGYPESQRIALRRTIYQINNGAAGAPYYAQEQTPWSPKVSGFTTQNALVLFDVEGKRIRMRVLNPDTLEAVDEMTLRE
ncbi:MAG: hypothetical protein OHK0039_09950 [Bacteroidia bacterium]